jgi:hypothetical protein
MTICFQFGDPLIDVLDYIVEVCQPGHDLPRLLCCVLVGKNLVDVPKVE